MRADGEGHEARNYVGLMSGTSLDGLDAVLLEIEGDDPDSFRWILRAFVSEAYGGDRSRRVRAAVEGGGARELCLLHAELGRWMGEAVTEVCRLAGIPVREVSAVGAHGQTVWHEPPEEGRKGATLQLGSAAEVAEATGIPVVSDFRSRDVAAGGHGAPLVPWADRLLFSLPDRRRALQNLGGMGNVTWLPEAGSSEPVVAFDTGPGVALLDAAAARATGGRLAFDEGGRLASAGRVDRELLDRLLDDPFFHRPPPRSTGRERFGSALVEELSGGLEEGRPREGWPDLLATLTELTARSVGDAYRRWILPRGVDEVVLTGGGARNPALAGAIRDELDPVPVRTGEEALGMDPDAREAAAFAVLAWAHLQRLPANSPSSTGARGPRILGSLTPGRRAAGEPEGP